MSNYRLYNFLLLLLLYLTQGIPFGFQVTALPVLFRQAGVSLTIIGFSSLLALPWMIKLLWAPLVDRFFIQSLGRRKSWLIPLQSMMCVIAFVATHIDIAVSPVLFAVIIFIMNFCASIQDIAVDGLAVDILKEHELGYGNAIQVVGYKIGMLISGGFLVWISAYLSWQNVFYIMCAVIAIPIMLLITYNEHSMSSHTITRITMHEILTHLENVLKNHTVLPILFLIATYKLGETFIDGMFKPFLVDQGFSASHIGLWQGIYGMLASIIGSLTGGLLSSRYGVVKGLWISLVVRIFPLIAEWYCTLVVPENGLIISVTIAEHFFGGMLTTAMFAFMMFTVDKVIGATHYTALTTIEVIGKSPGMWFSGLLADTIGYSYLFAIGIMLSLVPIMIMFRFKKHITT